MCHCAAHAQEPMLGVDWPTGRVLPLGGKTRNGKMEKEQLHELASWRAFERICQKSLSKGIQIAESVTESDRKRKERIGSHIGDICCPLPFSLQDLCLFVVISDLDSYEERLLALLPQWLRRRILKILPALDLHRYEETAVASGVDIGAIWESRQQKTQVKLFTAAPSCGTSKVGFMLNVSKEKHLAPKKGPLTKEIETAFSEVNPSKFSSEKEKLLSEASDILSKYPKIELDQVIHKLISIEGDVVYANMLSGCTCRASQCSQRVWNSQATSLAVDVKLLNPNRHQFRIPLQLFSAAKQSVRLTPYRSLPILYDRDPLQVLSLLTRDCNLQPTSAYIQVESISQPFLLHLSTERLAIDSGFTNNLSWTSVISHFLRKVVILRLQCDCYSNIGVMIGMIEAATVDKEESPLKYLFCTLPNFYSDIIHSLSSLFSIQNFHQLTLEVDELYPLMLLKFLQAFMTAPCSCAQKLMIINKKALELPISFEQNQLAGFCKGSTYAAILPHVSQHKSLQFSSQKDFTRSMYLILQLPTIRLKKITLVRLEENHDYDESHEYVHLCAVHPDLSTSKLVIEMGNTIEEVLSQKFLATIQDDLVSFFRKPSLQSFTIFGNWGKFEQIKNGLVYGLRDRTRRSLPLKKLALELELCNYYKKSDFQVLCDAIFSLPHLENLKLVLGKGFVDLIKQPGYEETLYSSWSRRAARVQLRLIHLQTYKTALEKLSLVAQKLSFSAEKRVKYRSSMYQNSSLLDSMLFFGSEPDYYDDYDYHDYYYDDHDYYSD